MPKFRKEDYEHELVRSSCRFERLKNPTYRGYLILKHVRKHLVENEWKRWDDDHIATAVLWTDICISRVNSDLVV
jgi:hypothetical protein